MQLKDYIKDGLLKIKVTPNASKTELKFMSKALKLYLQEVPDKGKANAAIIKFFKKEHGLKVRIKSGEISREKVLEILD
jgi:uncharacterized protein